MNNISTIQVEEHDNIGRLFREKLEFAEIIPSASLGNELMSKTARKEFLRFNPTRINIYYITALLAVAAAALIFLVSGERQSEPVPQPVQTQSSSVQVIPGKPERSGQVLSERKPEVNAGSKSSVGSEKGRNDSAASVVHISGAAAETALNSIPVHGISSIKDIFSGKPGDRNELKGLITVPGLIEAQVAEGCAPLKVIFRCSNGSYDSYQWSFGNAGISDLEEPEWVFKTEGLYQVGLIVRRSDGISLASFTSIRVHGKPVARFEIRQSENEDNETNFINYSLNASKFRWSFGDGSESEIFEPDHIYSKPGSYRVMLIASSENGCTDTLITDNLYAGENYFVRFPNAFIPNAGGPTGGLFSTKSDESAQIFHPVFSGVAEYKLRIFSKIGVLIFETSDINTGWDGYFNGQLSESGVYVWKVMGTYLNGERFIMSGDVTLLKAER